MRTLRWLGTWMMAAALGCSSPAEPSQTDASAADSADSAADTAMLGGGGALIATRYASLQDLGKVVEIAYFGADGQPAQAGETPTMVQVTHRANGRTAVGTVHAGVSQGDIMDVQKGGIFAKAGLAWDSPYAIASRRDLEIVMHLARRRPNFFGQGDPAFLDFAEYMVAHINTPDIAYLQPGDTSEKGYLNTFNHITAQAFITSFFSEELADFVGDAHERHNMREIVTGIFTDEQLHNKDNNPVDNYVDIVNNEWGQEIGKQLKRKYNISKSTWWTAELLANYLNDIQTHNAWALQIGLQPFQPTDEVVYRFADKINFIMKSEEH